LKEPRENGVPRFYDHEIHPKQGWPKIGAFCPALAKAGPLPRGHRFDLRYRTQLVQFLATPASRPVGPKGRGLVHFSAVTVRSPAWTLPENMDLTPSRWTSQFPSGRSWVNEANPLAFREGERPLSSVSQPNHALARLPRASRRVGRRDSDGNSIKEQASRILPRCVTRSNYYCRLSISITSLSRPSAERSSVRRAS
jgi:hypothetical protein